MATQGKWKLLIIEPDASRLIIRDIDGFICEVTIRDDGMTNAELITTAVNFFKSFSPKNPQAAAESLKDLVRACKKWTRGEIDNAGLSDAITKAGIR